jgi:hypothetical protein
MFLIISKSCDFKTDEQREELKKRTDDIASEMLDKTKKHEETYLNELKEQALFGDCVI